MTPDRLHRIRTVYESALLKTTEAQGEFIRQECAGDPEAIAEIERWLTVRIPNWLSQPVLGSAPPMEGRQLGPYRLLHEVGHGGMGTVYLAERNDQVFERNVAIKLLRSAMSTAEEVERFRHERRILATLDHPNIARLLDGGETEEGLPWLAMEFVDGQPVDVWCDRNKLTITARLELFRSVCSAVQYAHRHLVVHRDLKPGNIFVTPEGVVKLLDFGIARLIEPETPGEPADTATILGMMTPEYASPEQVNGRKITTSADVYSLGVVLYRLLTGHRPYRLTSAAMHEIARVISEEEPTRPSEAVGGSTGLRADTGMAEADQKNWQRRLAGDLDSIVLKTLRKEPDRRYSSVEAFDADLQRHLEKRPVEARGDSFSYRFTRLIQRHRGLVLGASLMSVCLVLAIVATLWQTRILLEEHTSAPESGVTLLPQIVAFLSLGLIAFSCAIYFCRPRLKRLAGAIAGAIVFAFAAVAQIQFGLSVGWWRSKLPANGAADILVSPPAFFLSMTAGVAVLLLLWRVSRRFGWRVQVALIALLGPLVAVRERIWYTSFLPLMTASNGFVPVLVDAAFWAAGMLFGVFTMRLIAGRADADPLAQRH